MFSLTHSNVHCTDYFTLKQRAHSERIALNIDLTNDAVACLCGLTNGINS